MVELTFLIDTLIVIGPWKVIVDLYIAKDMFSTGYKDFN
jgi:hypothetical protein